MFSKAQYEAVINEIESGMTSFETNLAEIGPAARIAMNQWFITDEIAAAISWLAEKTVEVGTAILEWFRDLLKGAVAPVYMFFDAWEWMNIKGEANGVSTNLTAQNLVVDDTDWSGKARDAYLAAAGAQSAAAGRIGSIASTASVNLLACAAAGLAFYIVLAGVLVKLIAATVAAIAAFGSAVFSWAGAAIVLEEAGVNTAVVGTAAAALTTFLAAQATAMVTLHGEAVDPTSFPGGVWPKSNTALYSDATVKDGDADWSLKPAG